MQNLFYFLLLSLVLASCSSTHSYSNNSEIGTSTQSIDDPTAEIDLTTHLRKFSGLIIDGQGPNARLKLRGINSFSTNTEPLLLLDGSPVSNYFELFNNIRVPNIKRIEVLKNPAETAIYGVRGANGVVKITSKSR